jgi:predicted RNase H-like nuclease (RuvC/YqgF family)
MTEIKEGLRLGIGKGFFHVQKDHGDGWFQVGLKKHIDAENGHTISLPLEALEELAKVEKAELKIKALQTKVSYWQQKDENKEAAFKRLNLMICELQDGYEFEQNRVITLANDISTLQKENKTNLVQISDLKEEIEDLQFKKTSNGFLAWSGWGFFFLSLLIVIFFR